MQPPRRDADLGAEAEFAAVAELRRRVPHAHRGIEPVEEGARRRLVLRDDRLGMFRSVAADVVERALDAVHHLHRQDGVEPFGREVLVGGRGQVGQDRPRGRIGAEVAAEGAQVGHQHRQQRGGDGGVDQQRLGRAADAGAAHLGIGQDGARHRGIRRGMDVGVAEPFRMREHGHARFLEHAGHEALAAARDDQVDQARGAQHRAHEGAVGGGCHLHRGFRQPRRAQARGHAGMDGGGGARALGPAAQDHGIAGLQAERRGIRRHVRAAFEDHAHHADRLGDAAHHQPVGPGPFREDAAHRVGQCRDLLQPARHRLDPRGGQGEAVAEGGREPRRGFEIRGIGGEDSIGARAQRRRGGPQGGILHRGRSARDRAGGGTGGAGGGLEKAGGVLGHGVHGQALTRRGRGRKGPALTCRRASGPRSG